MKRPAEKQNEKENMELETLAEIRRLEAAAAVGGKCEREIKDRTRRTAPAEVIDARVRDEGEEPLRASVSNNLPWVCWAGSVATPAQQPLEFPWQPAGCWETARTRGDMSQIRFSSACCLFYLTPFLLPSPTWRPGSLGSIFHHRDSILACFSRLTFIQNGGGRDRVGNVTGACQRCRSAEG